LKLDAEFSVQFVHRLRFTADALDPANATLADVLDAADAGPARALAFVDQGVAAAHSGTASRLERYAAAHADRMELCGPVHPVPGGESAKNDPRHLQHVLAAIHEAGLCRQSYVIAIGGGAVLDVVGYAAATAHRGMRIIRLPSTTLSQADSGIGVKNGVNAFGKKNYIGTFSPPWAVINDSEWLTTLSDRDWRCGFAEAVKVALIKDAGFFDAVARDAACIGRRDMAAALPAIQRSAELHLQHIVGSGDPFEMSRARPLDFGHWAAHKLEQMTAFKMRHGEAVAIGVAIDTTYSELIGRLDSEAAQAVRRCLSELGFALYDEILDDGSVLLDGLEEFREHLGGPLTITLLSGVGRPFESHEIDPAIMRTAIERLAAGRTHQRLRRVV
jgi:3-dehydroquinate synthase